ncbi:MAG: hypothetical protein MJE77_26195 [Proteobacteria bacterium]|nr:hypothetical protein [Pseudomonadota bacterium]
MSALGGLAFRIMGARVAVWAGKFVPGPVPMSVIESLEDIEVVDKDHGRSGFQISFRAERRGILGVLDYPQLALRTLSPGNRIIIAAWLGVKPAVVMDGIITHLDLDPVNKRVTLTGEDLAVVMDRDEQLVHHTGLTPSWIVLKILAAYARYGIIAKIIPPRVNKVPGPHDGCPTQHATDLVYLERLAETCGYIFYLEPGPAPGAATAYWGPPQRTALPQPALKADLGGQSNLTSIAFRTDAMATTGVTGSVKDPQTHMTIPVKTIRSTRVPMSKGELLGTLSRTIRLGGVEGESWSAAMARAQAHTDRSTDDVVTAQGELDTVRYGAVLRARGTVGIQGAGYRHDGNYYIKRVTHKIKRGSYTQSFTLTRGGSGSLTPVVRP